MAYLVGVKNVAPWRILAVTFTNKAAGEMRERIIALVGADDGRKVEMGTFHALCARILRRDGAAIGLSPRFVIYDTDDQQSLMKQAFRDLDLPIQGGVLRPRTVLEAISRAKNNLESVEDLVEGATTHFEREVARIATRYTERLRAAGALDFDDLLVETVRLLETQPEVLARYQARWRYLHVDEYQDTNAAQYRIVRALAAAHHNLCVVGDDDQSIYAWRGADLRNILDFERDEPGATVVKLEQNYRSTQLILRAAHAVVGEQRGPQGEGALDRARRRPADRSASRPTTRRRRPSGSPARSKPSSAAERERAHPAGRRGGEAAPEGDRRPLPDERPVPGDRGGVPALRAPLPAHRRHPLLPAPRGQGRARLPAGPAQRHRHRQLRADRQPAGARDRRQDPRGPADGGAPSPSRPTGAASSGRPRASCSCWRRAPRAAVADFVALVRRLRSRIGVLGLPELLDDVLEVSGYRAMLADGTEENEERWRNLLELRSVTTRYDDLAPDDALDRLLEETALVADQDAYEADADAVTLITLHAAKGLEFGAVFISGMEEGVFPHSRALDDETQLEEERRLAYVGHHPGEGAPLPLPRLAARHVGPGRRRAVGPVALPVRDPGRPDGGAAPRSRGRGATPPTTWTSPSGPGGAAASAPRSGRAAAPTGRGAAGRARPRRGQPFVPSRDLAARRAAFDAGAPSGSLAVPGPARRSATAAGGSEDHPDADFPDDLPVRRCRRAPGGRQRPRPPRVRAPRPRSRASASSATATASPTPASATASS